MKNRFFREEEPAETEEISLNNALGLALVTMVLLAFGLIMLNSASSGDVAKAVTFFRNQLIWSCAGIVLGMVAIFAGYHFLLRHWWVWFSGCALLLVWARLSRPVNGAYRWIRLGPYTFQPSELTKVAVAIFVAWYCSEFSRTFGMIRSKRGIAPLGLGCGVLIALILLGHDLGTTLLVSAMAFLTMMVAGLPWYYVACPVTALPLGVLYLRAFDQMRWLRMTIFLDPETHQQEAGYQLWNSLLALGSGNWYGVGLMSSRLKQKYLPEAHTDFILSIVGEELGFIGLIAVLLGYTCWGYFAVRITLQARDRQGMLLGWALTLGVVLQSAVNFGAMSGIFPTKGMPAPFISYGGSNLLGCLLATGILLSIAMEAHAPEYRKRFFSHWKRKIFFLPEGKEE